MKNEHIRWFSSYFGINLPQYELDFVDFNLSSDVPLYIDPYAITKDNTDVGIACHNDIVSFFNLLRSYIKKEDKKVIKQLTFGRWSEPVEIYLGVGKKPHSGRGVGSEQEALIIEALANSKIVKKGLIQTIQELELHIEGIGSDKVSDLVANIILSSLAKYTEQCCKEYGISTQPVALSGFWNSSTLEWDGGYFNLPVVEDSPLVLVPKRFVRREYDLMNHREFYKKYALSIIQREMIDANDSLVRTLSTGEKRVTKTALEKDPRFELSKEFLTEFVISHPDSIERYRKDLLGSYKPVDPAIYTGKSLVDDPDIESLIEKLPNIPTGTKTATQYQDLVLCMLKFVFDAYLSDFKWEYKMDNGRSRIDIIALNTATGGLFEYLKINLKSLSIPIECKNYSSSLGNDEFNQISERLGKTTSRFGMLFCRTIDDATAMINHQTDRWFRQENMILLIDDITLLKLVNSRIERDYSGIETTIQSLIRDVQFRNS